MPAFRTRAFCHFCDNVVTLQRRNRDKGDIGDAEFGGKNRYIRQRSLKTDFVIIDQIHLVDRNQNVRNLQERRQKAVALGSREHPLVGVDQHTDSSALTSR